MNRGDRIRWLIVAVLCALSLAALVYFGIPYADFLWRLSAEWWGS